MKTKTYFAIANVGEGRAHTAVMTGPAWDAQHPDGWTYQEAAGFGGTVLLEATREDEADAAVKAYNAESGS